MSDANDRRVRTKARYDFINFIRPDGFWPHPYTIEQALQVFAWMLKTGEPYDEPGRWGVVSIRSLLSCKPTCTNFSEVEPIAGVSDLRRRFQYAILARCSDSLEEWRDKFRVRPNGSRVIYFPHEASSESPAAMKDAVDDLFQSTGRLSVNLNSVWQEKAREIYGVRLHWRGSWECWLRYGFDGSVWHHCLAEQEPNEPIFSVIKRAKAALEEISERS